MWAAVQLCRRGATLIWFALRPDWYNYQNGSTRTSTRVTPEVRRRGSSLDRRPALLRQPVVHLFAESVVLPPVRRGDGLRPLACRCSALVVAGVIYVIGHERWGFGATVLWCRSRTDHSGVGSCGSRRLFRLDLRCPSVSCRSDCCVLRRRRASGHSLSVPRQGSQSSRIRSARR